MTTAYLSIIPSMAPLSEPMVEVVLENMHMTHKGAAYLPSHSEWQEIVQRVEEKRDFVYDYMNPVLRSGELSTNWVIETLTKFTPSTALNRPLSAETISRWRQNGLLLYKGKNQPDAASVAALVTLRLLVQKRQRRWTPKVSSFESTWWCWRQDSPHSSIIPCGLPLSPEVPRHALLWTPWTGAAWDPLWFQFGELGAARWAGIQQEENGTWHWNLEENDLLMWGGDDIVKYERGLLDSVAREVRHTTATLLLLSHASSRLMQKTT